MDDIKLLTFYTASHAMLFHDYFMDSLARNVRGVNLLPFHGEQLSEKGEFLSKGFERTMFYKIDHIIANIDPTSDAPLVFSDCDVQFFGDFASRVVDDLGDCDLMFQDDITCSCAGFFLARQSENVRSLFERVRSIMEENRTEDGELRSGIGDQRILNQLIATERELRIGRLPRDIYFTVAAATGPVHWNGEDFEVPGSILVHHANWTFGVKNKIALLEKVREKVSSRHETGSE